MIDKDKEEVVSLSSIKKTSTKRKTHKKEELKPIGEEKYDPTMEGIIPEEDESVDLSSMKVAEDKEAKVKAEANIKDPNYSLNTKYKDTEEAEKVEYVSDPDSINIENDDEVKNDIRKPTRKIVGSMDAAKAEMVEEQVYDGNYEDSKELGKSEEAIDNFNARNLKIDDNDFEEPEEEIDPDEQIIPEDVKNELDKENDGIVLDTDVHVFTEEEQEKIRTDIVEQIKKMLNPQYENDDFKRFELGKPIKASNIDLKVDKFTVDHVLSHSKMPISMSEMDGHEANILAGNLDEEKSDYTQTIEKLKIMYDHIVSPKPKTMTEWLKETPYADYNNYWMTAYRACFEKSNFAVSKCQACQGFSLSKDIPIKDMFIFNDQIKDAEKQFYDILNKPHTDKLYIIKKKTYRISNNYLFELQRASLWSGLIEPLFLDRTFRNKYKDIINMMQYISKIYYIDSKNQQIRVVDYWSDIDVQDQNKNMKIIKNKIKIYGKIIVNELKKNEYNKLISKMNNILINDLNEELVAYKIPELVCPHCGKKIPPIYTDARDLLFTHHQEELAALM